MGLFYEYKITDRRTRKVYHATQWLSLLPIFIVGLFFISAKTISHPGLWAAIGILCGAQLILTGAYRLHSTNDQLSPLGKRLADSSDEWFPFLLFIVQNVCIVTVILVLWFALKMLGTPLSGTMTINLVLLILLIPVRLICQELARVRNSLNWEHAKVLLNYPIIAISATLVASMISTTMLSNLAESEEAVPPPILIIWVPAWLVVLGALLTFIYRLRKGHTLY